MRHLKHNRSGTLIESSRILNPHRGVVLPPLPTTWVEKNPHLVTTKILVNKSKSTEVPGSAVTAEIVTVGTSTSRCTDPLLRIAQLEQNIRFLQEQHQQMLTGLHQEIEGLRARNRDLQFQLVFSKGSIASPNSASPSSPEEDSKIRVLSPRQVNVTPLQVELLEKELGELKITLQEVNTRNAYLTAIVDEQKKKLERVDNTAPSPDLISKLDDVESLVRKLRRENDDLRREVTDIRAGPGPNPREHRGGRHRGHYRGHRFPPLHTQSYWREKEGEGSGTTLPSLNMNHTQNQQQQQHSTSHGGQHYTGGKRSGNNNHHQYQQGGGGGNGGKYRGSQSRGHKS